MLRGLHKLCDKGNWSDATALLQTNAVKPSEKGGWGDWTPLHLACKRDPPPSFVQTLVDAAPDATRVTDMYGRLPVHHAAEKGASLDVMRILLEAFPEGVGKVDVAGKTPLHLGFGGCNRESRHRSSPPNIEEVSVLLGDDPNLNPAGIQDGEGFLPLHSACDIIDLVHPSVLSALVAAHPPSVIVTNSEGSTALHLAFLKALEEPASLEAVRALLPDGFASRVCGIQDDAGRLPIHCACKNFAPFEVLQELLARSAHSASVMCKCDAENGNPQRPIDILEKMRPTITTEEELDELNFNSDLLFAAYPDVLPYRTQPDRLGRLEELIVYEAGSGEELSTAARSVWIFLCTYPDDPQRLYERLVGRILDTLDRDAGRALSSVMVPADGGKDSVMVKDAAVEGVARLLSTYFIFADRFEFGKNKDRHSNSTAVIHRGLTSVLVEAWDCNPSSLPQAGQASNGRQRVVIKFESDRSKFLLETTNYNLLLERSHGSNAVSVPMIDNYDVERVSTAAETPGDGPFLRDISLGEDEATENQRKGPAGLELSHYPYAIVLAWGDRDLEDILKHEGVLEKDEEEGREEELIVRRFGMEIGSSLKELHKLDLVCGNLGKSSFVRFQNELRLTNLSSVRDAKARPLAGGIIPGSPNNPKTARLPPEMFAKLNSAQVLSYCQYWTTIREDAQVEKLLSSFPGLKDVLLTKARSYLNDEMGEYYLLDVLVGRFRDNAKVWKAIRPHRVIDKNDGNDEKFYVPRVYRFDEASGLPIRPGQLPYDLLALDGSVNVWTYALVLFELLTGKTLFRDDGSGNLVQKSDFVKLTKWDSDSVWEILVGANGDFAVDGPLARDLFRTILSPMKGEEDRPDSMESVLTHAYFADEMTQEQLDRTKLEILSEEHDRENELAEAKLAEKRKADWITSTTTVLPPLLSDDVQLKFHRSTARLWNALCPRGDASDLLFPTCYILLPYELQWTVVKDDEQALMVSNEDRELATFVASRLLDAVLFTSVSSQLLKGQTKLELRWSKLGEERMLEFSQRSASRNSCAVEACEEVLSKVANAEGILFDIFEGVVSDPSVVAKKIISDVVEEYVNTNMCSDILSKVRDAEKAFALLIDGVVDDPASTAREMVSNKFGDLIDGTFRTSLTEVKPQLDEALSEIVKTFVNDPIGAVRQQFSQRIEELLEAYTSSRTTFFYLVDEHSGRPAVGSCFPLELQTKEEDIRQFLFGLFVSLKSLCSVNIVAGIVPVVGLSLEDSRDTGFCKNVPQQDMIELHVDSEVSDSEFTVLQETLIGNDALDSFKNGQGRVATEQATKSNLLYLESFLESMDPGKTYSGLRRLKGPFNTYLWTSSEGEKDILQSGESKLMKYYGTKRAEVSKLFQAPEAQKEESANEDSHSQGDVMRYGTETAASISGTASTSPSSCGYSASSAKASNKDGYSKVNDTEPLRSIGGHNQNGMAMPQVTLSQAKVRADSIPPIPLGASNSSKHVPGAVSGGFRANSQDIEDARSIYSATSSGGYSNGSKGPRTPTRRPMLISTAGKTLTSRGSSSPSGSLSSRKSTAMLKQESSPPKQDSMRRRRRQWKK